MKSNTAASTSLHVDSRKNSAVRLSPLDATKSKRRRVYPTPQELPTPIPLNLKDSHKEDEHAKQTSLPTDIWRWTFSRDAIAPCFVKDVFDMRESETKGT